MCLLYRIYSSCKLFLSIIYFHCFDNTFMHSVITYLGEHDSTNTPAHMCVWCDHRQVAITLSDSSCLELRSVSDIKLESSLRKSKRE